MPLFVLADHVVDAMKRGFVTNGIRLAVGLFLLARKTEDKVGRTSMFVLAALNLVVLLLRLFT